LITITSAPGARFSSVEASTSSTSSPEAGEPASSASFMAGEPPPSRSRTRSVAAWPDENQRELSSGSASSGMLTTPPSSGRRDSGSSARAVPEPRSARKPRPSTSLAAPVLEAPPAPPSKRASRAVTARSPGGNPNEAPSTESAVPVSVGESVTSVTAPFTRLAGDRGTR
jgi:hypothetical protein